MPQSVSCDFSLYSDDSSLSVTDKDITYIEKKLNENLSSLCDWLVDNKLSIHLGKTECILFGTANKLKKNNLLNISYQNTKIIQKNEVKYLGVVLDKNLKCDSMVKNVSTKVSNKLCFLYRKQKYLDKDVRRLLCNALIQKHYDYACSSWYPLLTKTLKKRLQVTQNKCIRFCLNLNNRVRIDKPKFKDINWLPIEKRVEQCISAIVFKYFLKNVPSYIEDILVPKVTKYDFRKPNILTLPFCTTSIGQKAISFQAPRIWADIPLQVKKKESLTCFKHEYKRNFFKDEVI